MNNVHQFTVGQATMNKLVIEHYEALNARLERLEGENGGDFPNVNSLTPI